MSAGPSGPLTTERVSGREMTFAGPLSGSMPRSDEDGPPSQQRPANPKPPAKPTLLDRVRGIFTAEKLTQRQTYFQLVRRSMGKELSAVEIESLTAAMRVCNFTDADLAEHTLLLTKHAQAVEGVDQLRKARIVLQAAQAEADEFDKKELAPVIANRDKLATALSNATQDFQFVSQAESRLRDAELNMQGVFGEE